MEGHRASIFEIPLFGIGFRPFFLGGCISGILSLSIWIASFAFGRSYFMCDLFWHAHEMIYGFFAAIIIGFLYTASQNWTGIRGIHGKRLALIFALWLLGRVSFLVPMEPPLRAVLDLSFLPCAVIFLTPYLATQKQKRNMILLALPMFIWLGNLGYHLDQVGITTDQTRASLHFSTHIIVTINLLIAGRIIPFFSGNVISDYQKRNPGWFGIATVVASILFAGIYLIEPSSLLAKGLAFLSGIFCLVNLGRWFHPQVLKLPMLWVLFAAYAWFAIGYLSYSMMNIGFFTSSTILHAFTAGGISTMILGMISRVSLGHSGRIIETSPMITVSFLLITVGAILRVFGVFLLGSYNSQLMSLSAILWVLAFLLYILKYAPILLTSRADGKPG